MMRASLETERLEELTEQVWQDLDQKLARRRIHQGVVEVADLFQGARVTTFLPIILRRLTLEKLQAD